MIRFLPVLGALALGVATGAQSPPVLLQQAEAAAPAAKALTVAMGQPPALGSMLVLCLDTTSLRDAHVVGGGASQWRVCEKAQPTMGHAQIWAGIVDGPADVDVRIKLSGSGDVAAVVTEWGGFGATMTFRGRAATGTSAAVAVPAGGGPLTASAGDLVVAMVAANGGSRVQIGAPSGSFVGISGPTAGLARMAVALDTPTVGGPVSAQWTVAPAYRWAAAVVVFHMPVTDPPELVQQVANSAHDVAGLTLTLAQPPTPGNLLVLCHDSTSGSNSSVQGGGVTQWQLCRSSIPTQDNSQIWAGRVDGAPSTTIQITLGGSPNSTGAVVGEWSGFDVMPQITGQVTIGNDGSAASPATAGPIFADEGDLVVAMIGVHGGGQTIAPPTGGFVELLRPAPQPSSVMTGCHLVPTSGGLVGPTWTFGYRHLWASAIVVFHRP